MDWSDVLAYRLDARTFLAYRQNIWESVKKEVKALVTQSCPALCDPMDCSPPGSSVQGILQGRIVG